MGIIRGEIDFRLRWVGFDTRDVTLQIPLRAVWAAVEELDRRLISKRMNKVYGDIITITPNHSTGYEEAYGEWFECPNCGNDMIGHESNYCPGCGCRLRHLDAILNVMEKTGEASCHYGNERSKEMIRLGNKVKDKITGFKGIATAKVEYLNGCVQYCVKPQVSKDGKMPEGEYIDDAQLEVIEDISVSIGVEPDGGPMPDTPATRYSG